MPQDGRALTSAALATFHEGCMGETLAAVKAAAAAAHGCIFSRSRVYACHAMELKLDRANAQLTLMADDGAAAWTVGVDASAIQDAVFCEAFLWEPGGVACLGAAEQVWFFDIASGAPRLHLDLTELLGAGFSLFGHFGHATLADGTALLLVLGYADVLAIDASIAIRWIARGVAVDGITGANGCEEGDLLVVHAEMDPPGGWFEVTLDARTGREIRRTPDFGDGHVGTYQTRSPGD